MVDFRRKGKKEIETVTYVPFISSIQRIKRNTLLKVL